MNITKIGNKFKKHGVTVYFTKSYTKIVIYNSLKDTTAPVVTKLYLTKSKIVLDCVGNAETRGYRLVLTDRRDIVALLNIFYHNVKTKIKLQDIPSEIQEKVIADGEAKVDYIGFMCAYPVSIHECDGYVLFNGNYVKYGNIELLRGLKLRDENSMTNFEKVRGMLSPERIHNIPTTIIPV